MSKSAVLSASLEDYLEAIYRIFSERGGVRAKDIAKRLGVKAGSVTTALQALAKSEHINYQPYGIITLTEKGQDQAERIIRKHEVLKDFFEEILSAGPKLAEKGACQIEHAIPDELLERLISFTEFIQGCPRCGRDWIEQFHAQCRDSKNISLEHCQSCVQKCEKDISGRLTAGAAKRHLNLTEVDKGQKCIVVKLNRKGSATKRLVEMGISRGSVIEVERVAPLGDPIEVKVKGYHLSIRKEEAENIEVRIS